VNSHEILNATREIWNFSSA